MQCQCCNENSATIHLTEIHNGQRIENHLCQACAEKQGLAVQNHISLNELLSTLLAVQAEDGPEQKGKAMADISCPSCGITLEEFSKSSLLGCPHDYEIFDKQLAAIIKKTQNGNTTHCGKVPSRVPADTRNQIELMEMRRRLEVAVKNEDYEAAAELRDRIEQLQ